MDAIQVARRFPLVARSRPACTPLETRVGAVCALADSAERGGNQASASAVYNQVALLASDVGLPNLARAWCHRRADAYLRAHPPTQHGRVQPHLIGGVGTG
jgi:hypothetical protein